MWQEIRNLHRCPDYQRVAVDLYPDLYPMHEKRMLFLGWLGSQSTRRDPLSAPR